MDSMKDQSLLRTTGKRYSSVDALMKGEGVNPDARKRVAKLAAQTHISSTLAEMRTSAGKTQSQLAKEIGCTQSCISKWESEADSELTLATIAAYCRALNQRVNIFFGKPMKHVEEVKFHAVELKRSLMALSELAEKGDDKEIKRGVKAFFGEAFFNLLDILELCQKQLPEAEASKLDRNKVEIRLEVQTPAHLQRPSAPQLT